MKFTVYIQFCVDLSNGSCLKMIMMLLPGVIIHFAAPKMEWFLVSLDYTFSNYRVLSLEEYDAELSIRWNRESILLSLSWMSLEVLAKDIKVKERWKNYFVYSCQNIHTYIWSRLIGKLLWEFSGLLCSPHLMLLICQFFQLNAEKSPFQRTYAAQVYIFYISYHIIYFHHEYHSHIVFFCTYHSMLGFKL